MISLSELDSLIDREEASIASLVAEARATGMPVGGDYWKRLYQLREKRRVVALVEAAIKEVLV